MSELSISHEGVITYVLGGGAIVASMNRLGEVDIALPEGACVHVKREACGSLSKAVGALTEAADWAASELLPELQPDWAPKCPVCKGKTSWHIYIEPSGSYGFAFPNVTVAEVLCCACSWSTELRVRLADCQDEDESGPYTPVSFGGTPRNAAGNWDFGDDWEAQEEARFDWDFWPRFVEAMRRMAP